MTSIRFLTITLLLFIQCHFSFSENHRHDYVTVTASEAQGMGETLDEAIQNAVDTAIEQEVGLILSVDGTMLDGTLVERIVRYSAGVASNPWTLSKVPPHLSSNNRWEVRLRVDIARDALRRVVESAVKGYASVDATGIGATEEEARLDAQVAANRQALGMVLALDGATVDGRTQEKVMTRVRGRIDAMRDYQARVDAGGLYRVSLRADIDLNSLRQEIDFFGGKRPVVTVSGKTLLGGGDRSEPSDIERYDVNAYSRDKRARSAADMIAAFLERNRLDEFWYVKDYRFSMNERREAPPPNERLTKACGFPRGVWCDVSLAFDLDKYGQFLNEAREVFFQAETPRETSEAPRVEDMVGMFGRVTPERKRELNEKFGQGGTVRTNLRELIQYMEQNEDLKFSDTPDSQALKELVENSRRLKRARQAGAREKQLRQESAAAHVRLFHTADGMEGDFVNLPRETMHYLFVNHGRLFNRTAEPPLFVLALETVMRDTDEKYGFAYYWKPQAPEMTLTPVPREESELRGRDGMALDWSGRLFAAANRTEDRLDQFLRDWRKREERSRGQTRTDTEGLTYISCEETLDVSGVAPLLGNAKSEVKKGMTSHVAVLKDFPASRTGLSADILLIKFINTETRNAATVPDGVFALIAKSELSAALKAGTVNECREFAMSLTFRPGLTGEDLDEGMIEKQYRLDVPVPGGDVSWDIRMECIGNADATSMMSLHRMMGKRKYTEGLITRVHD